MLCGKCQLVCPRGVNTRNVILLIKKGISQIKQSENQINMPANLFTYPFLIGIIPCLLLLKPIWQMVYWSVKN